MICAFLHTDIHLEKARSVLKWAVNVSERQLLQTDRVFLQTKNPVSKKNPPHRAHLAHARCQGQCAKADRYHT